MVAAPFNEAVVDAFFDEAIVAAPFDEAVVDAFFGAHLFGSVFIVCDFIVSFEVEAEGSGLGMVWLASKY